MAPLRPLLLFTAVLFAPVTALAAGHDAAEQHLNVGLASAKKGRCELALPEFEASIALRETPAAHLAMGDCFVALGQPARAWNSFRAAERLGEATAADKAKKLEPQLLSVVIELPKNTSEVRVDGVMVPADQQKAPLRLDPAESHTLEVTASDGRRWLHSVDGKAGDTIRLKAFEEEKASPLMETPRRGDAGGTQRTIGLVTGGVGLTAMLVGGFFGYRAIVGRNDYENAVDARCVGRTCREGDRSDLGSLRDDALTSATLSTVLFIAGGLLTAGGVTLYLTAPSRGSAGMQVGGTF